MGGQRHLVTIFWSLKMHTDHVIDQGPVQKTVNNVRTNGKTGSMAWSNWQGLKSIKTHYFKPDQIKSGAGKSMFPFFFLLLFFFFFFSLSGIPQTRQKERYPNRFQHLPAETPHCPKTWKCQERQTGDADAEKKKRRKEPTEITISDMFTQMARLPVTRLGGVSL